MMTNVEQNKEDRTWRVPGSKKRHTLEEVYNIVRDYSRVVGFEYDIGVGTDSQMIGHAFQFISVISAHRVGKGGLYFYEKSFVPRAKFPVGNQKMRMFHEVARSIELAVNMQEAVNIKPTVHIDASPPAKEKEFTSKFSEQLRGYVQSCDFKCMLKPESYVAHAIADRHTKKRSRKRRGRNKKV
jgi:predicted RNase H-related nuclease YkuK (DUF458 family)